MKKEINNPYEGKRLLPEVDKETQIKRMLNYAEKISARVGNADGFKEFGLTKAKGEFDGLKLAGYFGDNGGIIEYGFDACQEFAEDFYQLKPVNNINKLHTDWGTKEVDNAELSCKFLANMRELKNHSILGSEFLDEQEEIRNELANKVVEKDDGWERE